MTAVFFVEDAGDAQMSGGTGLVGSGQRAAAGRGFIDSTAWGVVLSLSALTAASIAAVALSVDAQLISNTLALTTVGVGAITSVVYIGAAASS